MKLLALTKIKISNRVFKALVASIGPNDSCIDTLSLKSKHHNHQMTFYACNDNDYELQVDDFGFMKKNLWYQLQPTKNQLQILKDLLLKEYERLTDVPHEVEDNWDVRAEQGLYTYGY